MLDTTTYRRLAGRFLIVAIFATLTVLTFRPAPVWAHAYVVQSSPAVSQSLKHSPGIVEVEFDEDVQLVPGGLSVTNVDNQRIDLGDGHVTPTNPREIDIHIPKQLANGLYTIHWQVVSADGHLVSGTIPFGIGIDVNALHLGASETGYTPGVWMVIDRILQYAGLALALGGAVGLRLAEVAFPSLRHRAGKALVAIGWLMLLIGIGLDLPLQTAITWNVHGTSAFSARYIERTLNLTVFGYLWIVQMLILLIVPPMIASLLPAKVRHRTWWIALPLFLLPIAMGFSGHAIAENSPALPVFAIVIHLYAASIWVGGIAAILALVGQVAKQPATTDDALLRRTISRFSKIALICVAVLGLSGLYSAFLHIPTWYALFHTGYGQTLIVKLALFCLMLIFASAHALRRQAQRGTLRLFMDLELLISVGVFAMTAILTNLPTGDNHPGPVDAVHNVDGFRITLSITPNHVGENQFTVRVQGANGKPDTAIQQVALSFSSKTVSQGAEELRLLPRGPGVYVANGLALSGGGRWNVAVDILTNDFHDVITTFPIHVGQ
ncbi:copper resistance protein CopC [Alicyclobacillus tengchongensis]|nr:copper resistance protein CopC [Alicyclobacillus tengchongensis]